LLVAVVVVVAVAKPVLTLMQWWGHSTVVVCLPSVDAKCSTASTLCRLACVLRHSSIGALRCARSFFISHRLERHTHHSNTL
jgi:hypothetical protein